MKEKGIPIGLPYFSSNFPKNIENEIERDNILETIELLFNKENQIIVVEGEYEIGKTTLLAQFVLKHCFNTFSSFLNPINPFSCCIETVLEDLTPQIYWAVNNETLLNNKIDLIDFSLFKKIIFDLKRKKNHENQKYYFVIDGLSDTSKENENFIKDVLNILPLGEGFYFLISGIFDSINRYLPISNTLKSIPLQLNPFSLDETKSYLNITSITQNDLQEIRNICKGYPGRLANINRKLKEENISITQFLNQVTKYDDIFDLEWSKIEQSNELLIMLLAILSLDNRQHTIEKLSKILNQNIDIIEKTIKEVPFIEVCSNINFISSAHRKYYAEKLKYLQNKVDELIINYLLTQKDSPEAFQELPSLFRKNQNWDSIIELFSEKNIYNILSQNRSLYPLHKNIDLGFEAANNLNKFGDLLKFSIQKSIMTEFKELDIWETELEAIISINQYDKAIRLAQAAYLKEDRLRLLAIIARKQKENNIPIDEIVQEQIKDLYKQVNMSFFGEKIIDLVADLLYSFPNLAADLMEKSSDENTTQNINDWVLTKLRLAAISNNKKEISDSRDISVKLLDSKIKDPAVQKITDAISLLYGNYTVDQVLEEIRKIDKQNEQLQLLRLWISQNQHEKNIEEIIKYTIDLLISSSIQVTPNATILLDITKPFPHLENFEKSKILIGRIDIVINSIKEIGPTLDYIKSQLNIFRSEINFDYSKAINRLYEIYFEINEISDLSIRTDCIAVLYAAMKRNESLLDKEAILLKEVKDTLCSNVDLILKTTAHHFDIIRCIIKSLAMDDPMLCIDFSSKLNTLLRRNRAYYEIFDNYLKKPLSQINYDIVKIIYNKMTILLLKESVIIKYLQKFDNTKENVEKYLSDYEKLIPLIDDFMYVDKKCYAYILVYRIIYPFAEKYPEAINQVTNNIHNNVESIDSLWEKIDMCYTIVSMLSNINKDISEQYLKIADVEKEKSWLCSPNRASLFILNIKLLLRSLSGLFINNSYSSDDLDKVKQLIQDIPSYYAQLCLWTNLSLYSHLKRKFDLMNSIVENHIKPLIIKIIDNGSRYDAIEYCAPVLFLSHQKTAYEIINTVPNEFKDDIYSKICSYIINKVLPDEPLADGKENINVKIKYEEANDICDLIEHLTTDSNIYYYVKKISNCIDSSSIIADTQKASLRERISKIISTKLPDRENIVHEGYKIVAESLILKTQRKDAKNQQLWDKLISRADNVENLSDKAFIYALIADAIPENLLTFRNSVLDKGIKTIENIHSYFERIERFEDIAEIMYKVNQNLCKEKLKSAFENSVNSNNKDLFVVQKNIIDFVNKYDPNLAKVLIDYYDKDPARNNTNKALSNYFEELKITNNIINNKFIFEDISDDKDTFNKDLQFAQAVWSLLGYYNARLIVHKKVEQTKDWLKPTLNLSFTDSYPLMSCFVENAVLRHEKTDESATILKSLFENIYINCKLLKVISEKLSCSDDKDDIFDNITIKDNLTVKPGDIEEVIQFFNNWIEDKVHDYLKICDPYFCENDLWLLKSILTYKPNIKINIITSLGNLKDANEIYKLKDKLIQKWNEISKQEPPDTTITIAWSKFSLKNPIHDRWLISKNNGVRLGTSINSLGVSKESEISHMSQNERTNVEHSIIDKYILMKEKFYNGEKINYTSFNL